MKRKHTMILLLILLPLFLFTLSGCVPYDEPIPSPNEEKKEEEEKIVVDPKPAGEEKEITLYFMDKNIIETGQGDYGDMIKETREVMIDDRPVEQIIIDELQNGPTSVEAVTMVRKDLQIISVEVANETAYVNLASQNLFEGSLGETGFIYQVVSSLTELDSIDKVQFLVDGTRRESLFGHYSIEDPWTRDMIQ